MKRKSISTLFMVTGAVLFAGSFTMCRKDAKTCKASPEQSYPKTDKNGVVQKEGMVPSPDYHLTDKQNYELVKAFKARSKTKSRGQGGADDIALDLAQYELEASINFDFDSYGGSSMLDVHQDVSSYSFNSGADHPGSGYISSTELNGIYDQLRARFNAIVSTTVKIAAIDVVAYIDDATGKGHFEVAASVMQTTSAGNPYRCATAPWLANASYAHCSQAEMNGFFSCGLFAYPTGITGVRAQFQAEMNCRDLIYAGCDNGYYFASVNTVSVWPVANDTRLYSGPTTNVLNGYCSAAMGTTLSGAVFNNKLANAKAFVLNDCYSSGLDLVDNSTLINLHGWGISQTATGVMLWELVFQKGVRHCRPDPID